jgi:hypothetical protein
MDMALTLHRLHYWNVQHSEWILVIGILVAAAQAVANRRQAPQILRLLSRSAPPGFEVTFLAGMLVLESVALLGFLTGGLLLGGATNGLVCGVYLALIINLALGCPK